jgi:hypothetical protein
MKSPIYSCLLGILIANGMHAAEPELVARVAAGKLREARASWWGFDAEDSTAALQAALTSGVRRLVVDRQSGPWIVTPLTVPGDLELLFEDGVEVLAKQGEFRGKNDTLFSLSCVSNVTLRGYGATLRMRRDDYDAPPYVKAEWRHLLSIRGCENIQVLGLTLAESGGDGIYLGSVKSRPHNRNIVIKDVICNKNYRQGISVISAENLLIESVVLSNTGGTPPAAGIDFEPNHSHEVLKNIVMRGCLAHNNEGDGYLFALHQMRSASEPVSIRLERCRSVQDRSGVRLHTRNSEDDAVRGVLEFTDCVFESAERCAVQICSKPAHGAELIFQRCRALRCGAGEAGIGDVVLENRGGDAHPVGGMRLIDFDVLQPVERPWIVWRNNIFADQSVGGIDGSVAVTHGDGTVRLDLTPQWLAESFPPRFATRVPRAAFDWAAAKIRDTTNGVRRLQPLRMRGSATYWFYAQAGDEVLLTGEQRQVGRYEPSAKPLVVAALDGTVVKKVAMGAFGESVTVAGRAPASGFYRLDADAGANAFLLTSANVPVALAALDGPVKFIGSEGVLSLPVPPGTELFAVDVAGSGDREGVRCTLVTPGKTVAWQHDAITGIQRYTGGQDAEASSGLWKIRLMKPAAEGLAFEDFSVDVLGVPPFLFLHPARYWEF